MFFLPFHSVGRLADGITAKLAKLAVLHSTGRVLPFTSSGNGAWEMVCAFFSLPVQPASGMSW